jgi:hypothetical protein
MKGTVTNRTANATVNTADFLPLDQDCTASLFVSLVPICTDGAASVECLQYDNITVRYF